MDVQTETRLTITSRDGTRIACWRTGEGPALVLVHGATADHTRWETVLPLLDPHVTVYAMDRRGRGGSGDGASYRIEDEGADVAAVVEAVADATGGPVDVLGHSYGGLCVLEALVQTSRIRRAVLYEPGAGVPTSPGFADELAALLAAGRREEVVVRLLTVAAGVPADQLARMRALPSWPHRVAAAHTVVREVRAHDGYRLRPERFADLDVPTLLLVGSDSPAAEVESAATVAAALRGSRVVTVAGQGHVAMLTAPDLFATEVLAFLHDPAVPPPEAGPAPTPRAERGEDGSEEVYTLGAWRVADGRQDAFVEAWERLSRFFRSLPRPPAQGTLLQGLDEPRQFYSFGPWRTLDDVRAMRVRPDARRHLDELMQLCEEGRPGTFRVVATG
ncbi:alpha/beta fold hydrolase [Geodermatophilus sp. SYSU D01036]